MKTLASVLALTALLSSAPAFASTGKMVEGTIHTYCMNGADTCRAQIQIGDKSYTIQAPFSQFAGLDGATVKMHGSIDKLCPGGGTCSNFTPSSSSIEVYGQISMLMKDPIKVVRPIAPTAGNYILDMGNGHSIIVDYKGNLMADNNQDVWVRGTLNPAGGDLAPFLSATSIHRAESDAGSNVARDANTNGATADSASAASVGAGIRRN